MRITKESLKRIIKEEVSLFLEEESWRAQNVLGPDTGEYFVRIYGEDALVAEKVFHQFEFPQEGGIVEEEPDNLPRGNVGFLFFHLDDLDKMELFLREVSRRLGEIPDVQTFNFRVRTSDGGQLKVER